MEYMEQQMQNQIESGMSEAALAMVWYDLVAELKAERDALAAQLVAIQDAALKPRGRTRQQWIDNITRNALGITARQHLSEIRAEAGRAGFIAGYMWHVIEDHDDVEKQWAGQESELYAEQIRQGGK